MSKYYFKKKKKSNLAYFVVLFFVLAGSIYIYFSDNFERQKPQIDIKNQIYWNLKEPIKFVLRDNFALKSYRVCIIQDDKEFLLENISHIDKKTKILKITLKSPKSKLLSLKKPAFLKIEATDKSLWNFGGGNRAQKMVKMIIDTRRPIVNIISKSYALRKGGSALVVFEAKDKNLDHVYIQSSTGYIFKAIKFLKDGFYIALLGNDLKDRNFKMYIIATDKAHNSTKDFIPFYYKDRKYRVSKLNLRDRFLEGKIEQVFYENYDKGDAQSFDKLKKFRYVNETMRTNNTNLIKKYAKDVREKEFKGFNIEPFVPLKNAKKVGSFGDHRFFYYNKEFISESYHMGIDLASIKRDKIILSNDGYVVWTGRNGIYGNNVPIIYHGLGLYSIYGHCSGVFVNEGDKLKKGDIIARTGAEGLALGDHLHFGVLVQGIEVRPAEWLDGRWIKANITDVIQKAKKIIQSIR